MDSTPSDMLAAEMKECEREVTRLTCELWWLDEVAPCWARTRAAQERLAKEVEFATARLTRQRIEAALLASRIAHEAGMRA